MRPNRFPIVPQHLTALVRDAMPSNGIVTLDNGVYEIWFARNYRCHEPNTLLLDNALASMGAGLPSAIAAALAFISSTFLLIIRKTTVSSTRN
ncbi:MAG: hypothetical protein GY950_11675 [bacterium]|nr:hypothetical protein [bacterium]